MTDKRKVEYGIFYENEKGESFLYSTYKTFKLLVKAINTDKILWDTVEKNAAKITIVELDVDTDDKASHV